MDNCGTVTAQPWPGNAPRPAYQKTQPRECSTPARTL